MLDSTDTKPELSLEYAELNPYRSEYLAGGYRKDREIIRQATVNEGRIVATVDIVEFFMPSDGSFHLSDITNGRVMEQIGIIYTFASENRMKDREVYVIECSWKFQRPIRNPIGIRYEAHNIRRTDRRKLIVFDAECNVGNGAFIGTYRWARQR